MGCVVIVYAAKFYITHHLSADTNPGICEMCVTVGATCCGSCAIFAIVVVNIIAIVNIVIAYTNLDDYCAGNPEFDRLETLMFAR